MSSNRSQQLAENNFNNSRMATPVDLDNITLETMEENNAGNNCGGGSGEKTWDEAEQWLDDHPDFVTEYFSRKATRAMIDSWLIKHAITQGAMVPGAPQAPNTGTPQAPGSAFDAASTGSNSKTSSGTNTPVRKISAQEFERSGHVFKPMVSSIDGTPSFLGPAPSPLGITVTSASGDHPAGTSGTTGNSTHTTGNVTKTVMNRKSVSELKALDERELMYELVMDICNDLEVPSLCHKILQNVSLLLNADRCSLFLVRGDRERGKLLVSTLFDVTSQSSLQDCLDKTEEINVGWGCGIVGHVAETGETLNIPDAYADPRFNKSVDSKTGYKTRTILSMPIRDMTGEIIGVAQAINKISVRDEPFGETDEKVFASYLAFCGIGITNAQLYEKSLLENRRNQLLLDLARVIFEEQSHVVNLIHKIMMHTQSLLRCERCQVMLVAEASKDKNMKHFQSSPSSTQDMVKLRRTFRTRKCAAFSGMVKGVFSQVFDLEAGDFENDDSYHREGIQQPRFPINIGITGHVATTGETLNIPDVYADARFDPEVDKASSFKTKSILCMPIKNATGNVIGVAQLVNKQDGTSFNKNDENLFEAFAIFSGMGIHNTQMYEKAVRAVAKQRVALEVLSYHASAPIEEVQRLRKLTVPSLQHFRLDSLSFDDLLLSDDDTLKACSRMFMELDLIEKYHISYEVFCRWILSVKKNYRNVTYHNWRHAFNVCQTMFWMITHGDMWSVLDELECLALLVGCLCHDLDHRGTNNQFQIKTMSPLATLYSTSVLEHHHFDQCIMIINTKGNEILANLRQDEYERMIKILENAILATDLALYFKFRGQFMKLVEDGQMDLNREHHRDLLRSMMMTACDVAAITKPWSQQKRVAELVASEFFEQGDLEKSELHIMPMDMMNRDKKDQLPVMQVGFIDSVCLPVYQVLSKVNRQLMPLQRGCENNRHHWAKIAANDVVTDEVDDVIMTKNEADEKDRESMDKDNSNEKDDQRDGDQ